MKCRKAVHKDCRILGIVHRFLIYLIWRQGFDTLFPYFIRFSHGNPDIGIQNIGIFCAFFHTLGQCNRTAGCLGVFLALCYELRIWEIFFWRTCRKMHSHFRTGDHQGISHIVAGISHVNKFNAFQFSEFFLNCQKIC